jgi:hypothetical protein
VQWIKQRSASQLETLLILLGISIGAAGLYCYWETVGNVLVTAGAFYAFVIQRFESQG